MKKFTKGCLITALVLFVLGCAFYIICGVMGGFGQLKAWNGHTFHMWGHEMRLAYSGYGFWYITDADSGVEPADWDWADNGDQVGKGEKEKTEYSASDVWRLDIECGGNNLVIKESEDDYIWIARDSEAWPVKYKLQDGTFKLYSEKSFHWWGDWRWNERTERTVYLYLPEGMTLDSIDLEIGAGELECMSLKADEIDVEVDAGAAVIESLYGKEVELSVNAGGMEVEEVTAEELNGQTGAGSLVIGNFSAEEVSLTASAGSQEVYGKIGRNADIECEAGSITMTIQGAEADYDYELECSLGEIRIGGNTYRDLNDQRTIRNGGKGVLDIECSVGTIEIDFD